MVERASGTHRPLVFDLDGTLIDSRGDIAAACNHALVRTGRSALSVPDICRFVGDGAPYLLEHVSGVSQSSAEFPQLLAHFQAYYLEHSTDCTSVLPGAWAALRLAPRPIAVCTNKPRAVTELILDTLGISPLLSALVASGDCQYKKPHPEPLQLVARLLDVPPASLIMVGDGPQDVGSGRAVGAHTIGIRGGFLPESRLLESRPDVVLSSLEELPAYLEQTGL